MKTATAKMKTAMALAKPGPFGQCAQRWISAFACSNTIAIQKIPLEDHNRQSPLTKDGIKEMWEHSKMLRYVKKTLKNFDVPQFLKHCEKLYLDLNEQLSRSQYENTRCYVTPSFFSLIKSDYKKGPKYVFYWKFGGFTCQSRIVALAPLEIPNTPSPVNYFQIAVRFESRQGIGSIPQPPAEIVHMVNPKESFYSLFSDDSSIKMESVVEYYVFEKSQDDPYHNWRIAGKIEPAASA
ncbi:39S ribosomal protein L45 [Mitosporidium daphniae]